MYLTRRSFSTGLMATALAAPSVARAKLPLSDISAYFNAMTTAQTSFRQETADGARSSGKLWIKRPGRMRFEYDPPNAAMVVVGGGQLAIFDARSDEATKYPLRSTPLSVILQRNVNLSRANAVTGHGTAGDNTVVRAQDPDRTEYGFIDLYFSPGPIELVQWVIHDGDGGKTTVRLGALSKGGRVPDRLFNISAEERDWNPG